MLRQNISNGNAVNAARAGVGTYCQDRERQGGGESGNRSRGWPGPCRDRDPMEGFMSWPGSKYLPRLPPVNSKEKQCALTHFPDCGRIK